MFEYHQRAGTPGWYANYDKIDWGRVAQLAEPRLDKPKIAGSYPAPSTNQQKEAANEKEGRK